MSNEDKHPAQSDNARPVYPVMFYGEDDNSDSPYTDFRAIVTPADAPEDNEKGPKDSSAPEPAASSDSKNQIEEPAAPVKPVPEPAAKASGPAKAGSTGPRSSSPPKANGN